MTTPTLTIDKPLSTAAQAAYNALLQPFANGIIAGTTTPADFMSAQASVLAMLAERFGEGLWA